MDFIVDTVGDEVLQEKDELLDGDEALYTIEKTIVYKEVRDNLSGAFFSMFAALTRGLPLLSGTLLLVHIRVESVKKEDKTKNILKLFNDYKEELDNKAAADEELEKKLNNLKIDTLFDQFFEEMGWTVPILKRFNGKKKRLFHFEQLDHETGKLKTSMIGVDVEKQMEKSLLKPGIEKEQRLPPAHLSDKQLQRLRKKEREKTKGPKWFNLPAPEINDELKNDLQVLKMRSALDPKHFYKKNDMETLPKYFQVGKIMDSPLDHVNERLTKKQRKRTMVDELLADAEFQKYNKKKFKQIIEEKRKSEYRTFMKDKRQKNKAELKKKKLKARKRL